jgi:hypothetical protein
VPVAAAVAGSHGWGTIFVIAMGCNVLAAVLAIMVLAPLRTWHFDQAAAGLATVFPSARRSRVR